MSGRYSGEGLRESIWYWENTPLTLGAQICVEQLGLEFAPRKRTFSVSEVTALVRGLLEDTFDNCWVSGEISNARRAPSGHYYFTLKDSGAQLSCVCFRQNALYLKVKPADGLEVLARGRISVYEARGQYQLYVEAIEPQGYGALQLAFEELKKKLAGEGLFDDESKQPLPRFPARIGIVTSPSGAAIADMLRVLERRFPGLWVRLYPAAVQGDNAAPEIVKGLRHFNESGWPEVIIVGRGGGSLEDLWAFNEEPVARAIAASEIPVIAAVGHQTDFTIADFVADLRAPTPSAAAEVVVPERAEVVETVEILAARAQQAVRYRIARAGRRLVEAGVERPAAVVRRGLAQLWQRQDELDLRLRDSIRARLERGSRRLRDHRQSLDESDIRVRLARRRADLDRLQAALNPAIERRLERGRHRAESASERLQALSPVAILERGYAIVSTPEGEIIHSSDQTEPGGKLDVRLSQGRLKTTVESVEP